MIHLKCKICGRKRTIGNKQGYCKKCYLNTLTGKTHPNWKGENPHCVDCGKLLSLRSKKYNPKRCKSCSKKYYYKINPNFKKGKLHSFYGKKRPEHSKAIKGNKNGNYGKRFDRKNKIITHHIDLNYFNKDRTNLLKITLKKHTSLHHRAYDYLVKTGQIKKYIKWFFKTYKGNKSRTTRGRGILR